MLLLDKTLTHEGIDVYPDHDSEKSPNKFWYIPGKLQLARRDGKPVLSYMWYLIDPGDTIGEGFLNFEVNTAVSQNVLNQIKRKLWERLSKTREVAESDIILNEVEYTKGKVAFSALTSFAAAATEEVQPGKAAVVHRSQDQIVWQAGSPSLVGDNTAVCSVRFTREGKLAAAMHEAIALKANTAAAVYVLQFLAMRPAIRFKVVGSLDEFLFKYQANLDVPIPLEVIVADIGIETKGQVGYSKRKLHIELVDFTGDDKQKKKSLKWAKKILVEFLLKDFFTSAIETTQESVPGLARAPGDGDKLKDTDKLTNSPSAGDDDDDDDNLDDALADDDDGDDDDEDDEDSPKAKKKSEESKAEKKALSVIPTLTFKLKTSTTYMRRDLDYMYAEMKAIKRRAGARGFVLEGLADPPVEKHVFKVDRDRISYGQAYPVEVVGPKAEHFRKYGLRSVNLHQAQYPADAPESKRTNKPQKFDGAASEASNRTLDFRLDGDGNRKVAFKAELVFDPDSDTGWVSNATRYEVEGTREGGVINLIPGEHLDITEITVMLETGFIWKGVDTVVVIITSGVPGKSRRLEFTEAEKGPQQAKFRFTKELGGSRTFTHSAQLMENGENVGNPRTGSVDGEKLTIHDAFADKVAVTLVNLITSKVLVELSFEDTANDDSWSDDSIVLDRAGAIWKGSVPTKKKYKKVKDLPLTISVTPAEASGGDPFTINGSGGSNQIKRPSARP